MLLRDRFFVFLFIVLLIVAVIDIWGSMHFLFWKFWWLDIIVHFGGGFWAGGIILWMYTRSYVGRVTNYSNILFILLSIFSAFAAGMLWEVYQVLIESVNLSVENYFSDTVIDLIADGTGALLSALYFLRLHSTSYQDLRSGI